MIPRDEEKSQYLLDVMIKRRSIRSWTDKPVSLADLKTIVTAAKWAPTGGNRQQWKYCVVNDPKVMKEIIWTSPLLPGEPTAAIFICAHKSSVNHGSGYPGQNIMLMAHALGIGSCAVGAFNRSAVKKILQLPDEIEPAILIILGYANEVREPPQRQPWSETVFLNSFNRPWKEE